MSTYLGAPSPSSIAIFAGPVAQERSNFGAAAGAEAAAGEWNWNEIGKAATGIATGVTQWLQQMQKPPEATNTMGLQPRMDPSVTFTPTVQPAKPAVPQWAIGLGIVLALAAVGWVVLGKKRRR